MISFFAGLVMEEFLKEVYLHFLIPGHTKFSPDGMFGTLARLINSIMLVNLSQIAQKLNSRLKFNNAYRIEVMKPDDCHQYRDKYGKNATAMKEIKKCHHIQITKVKNQVVVKVKENSSLKWRTIQYNYNIPSSILLHPGKTEPKKLKKEVERDLGRLTKYIPFKEWKLEKIV